MPAASKSRHRRARRAPSSDNIEEEDDPSQRHADDVDNDEDSEEDVQPARKTATVKKEKKPKIDHGDAGAPVAGPSNANYNVDEGDDRIDIQNFHDQPLDRKEGAKLHGIAQDWEMIRKQIHQSSFRLVKDVAISLADLMEPGGAEEALDEVDAIMKKLLDIDQEMRSHEETLNNLHQALMRGEVVENVLETYETEVKRRVDEFKTKTTRQKYASIDTYVEFRQGIYEVQNSGGAIPPINDLVPREDGDSSGEDDDLEVGGVTQDYKCPITLMVLEDPMTSTVCGHSYSRAAIQEFLKRAQYGKPCPASGCNKRITMDDLKADKALEKRVKIAARRQQRREEEDLEDDDEVIE
ncbi:zinc-finger of the MIZ type in Nse subunit-domain-containing protein [Lanmaoa asiatica]|nr:zinc-finger of the MIZ type in Nse subunit-domain-containing protein [Lanmaoa asiatica]